MEILEMIAEWRKGRTNAGPMYDKMFPKDVPTSPCECIDCTEGLINAIEEKCRKEESSVNSELLKPFIRFRDGQWEAHYDRVTPQAIHFPVSVGNTPEEAAMRFYGYCGTSMMSGGGFYGNIFEVEYKDNDGSIKKWNERDIK